jgi:hypothetical protein
LKFSKLLLAASLLCAVVLMAISPALYVSAQGGTATPAGIVTATPGGTTGGTGADLGGVVASTATPDANGTPVPRELQAFRAARAVLSKKIGQRISYVKAWSWELVLFNDNALGCPAEGQQATPGSTAGYLITITMFDDKTYELHVTYDLSTTFYCTSVGGTSTSPTTNGALPAPVTGKATGGSFEAGGQIMDFNAGTIEKMRSAGLKWIKRQLPYGDGSGPGIVAAAHAQNFKVLFSVIAHDKNQVTNPAFMDQYAGFVAGLAAAGADGIEIWNEMNIDREWPQGQINPATYVQLLAKSYNAIKAANGNTLVVSGALAPTGAEGAFGVDRVWNDDRYYNGMAAAGAAQYLDCVGVHYNEGIVGPNQGSGDPRGGYPTYYFDSMLNRAIGGFGGKQACFTEIGYLSPEGYGPLPGGFAWAKDTSVAEQAQWLAEAAVKSAASGKVRLMIIFNVDFVFYGEDPQAGFAMIRPGGSCPACTSLGQVLK